MSLKNIYNSFKNNLTLLIFTLLLLGVSVSKKDKDVLDALYIAQHLLILVFAVSRKQPEAMDRAPITSLCIAVGMVYPIAGFYLINEPIDQATISIIANALIFVSLAIQYASLLSLNTSFGIRPAIRAIKSRGIYRFIRHPLYLAYFVLDTGYLIAYQSALLLLVMLVGWLSLIYRINAEESVLRKCQAYNEYCRQTHYRLIPGIY